MRIPAPMLTWSPESQGDISLTIPGSLVDDKRIVFSVRVTWRGHPLDVYISRSQKHISYHLFDGQAVHDFNFRLGGGFIPGSKPAPLFLDGSFCLHIHPRYETLGFLEWPVCLDNTKLCQCQPRIELPEPDKKLAAFCPQFAVRELTPEEKKVLHELSYAPCKPVYSAPACWQLRDGLVLYKREDGGRTWEQLVRYEEDKHIVVDSWFLGNYTESEKYASVAPAYQPALATMLGIESAEPLDLMQAILMRFHGTEAFQLFCEALYAHKVPCQTRGYDTSKG